MAKSEKHKTQRKNSHPESGLYFLLNEVQTPPQLSSAVAEGPGRRWKHGTHLRPTVGYLGSLEFFNFSTGKTNTQKFCFLPPMICSYKRVREKYTFPALEERQLKSFYFPGSGKLVDKQRGKVRKLPAYVSLRQEQLSSKRAEAELPAQRVKEKTLLATHKPCT